MAKISEKRKIYEMINDRIVDLLEKGEAPWHYQGVINYKIANICCPSHYFKSV